MTRPIRRGRPWPPCSKRLGFWPYHRKQAEQMAVDLDKYLAEHPDAHGLTWEEVKKEWGLS